MRVLGAPRLNHRVQTRLRERAASGEYAHAALPVAEAVRQGGVSTATAIANVSKQISDPLAVKCNAAVTATQATAKTRARSPRISG